jgi:cobyrinic acid a,c-diamide synthase
MSRLLISAAHKSSGKTTLAIGICAQLCRLGLAVQPFKKGPDYIDPLWLSRAAGRPCHNLDFYTQAREEMRQSFRHHLQGADLALIEGNKGLFDGLDLDGSNSNAALATLLDAPVILVIDTQGMTRGVAPLLRGYRAFDPRVRIAGVILNKVGGHRHEGKLRQVIEHYTDMPVIGAVHRVRDLEIVERHLGLMPSNESLEADSQIESIRRVVADQIDIPQLRAIADSAPALAPGLNAEQEHLPSPGPRVRIGVAMDEAFGFYYPGDLESMQREGAQLVSFSPIKDRELPEVDGIFIGGGFPETRMRELEANEAMRHAVRDFVERGGTLYAECGGLMYLARSINWQGNSCKMVGLVPADAVMNERPQGRGYVRLRRREHFPWPVAPGDAEGIAAHEFHYSGLENLAPAQTFAFEVLRGSGIDGSNDGIVYKRMLANYTHLRHVAGSPWTRWFVQQVRRSKSGEEVRSTSSPAE